MLMNLVPRIVALSALCALALAACTANSTTAPSPEPAVDSLPNQAPMPDFPDGVTSVECDLAEQARPADAAVAVLSDPTWRVGGWSHVTGVGAFETVKLGVGDYRITAENWLPDATCGDGKTLGVVLAKKIYDWDRQHANGMESQFGGEKLTFDGVTDVVLVLKFDPEVSHLPSAEEIVATYGDLAEAAQLAELDSGNVNLELTLFGQGANADQPFLNAGTIITIDPQQAAAGWVRVQIPRSELEFYTEENYARTPVADGEWGDLIVAGLRINPESSSGNVVRHILGDNFDGTAKPEMFKEMGLQFALIEVGRSS